MEFYFQLKKELLYNQQLSFFTRFFVLLRSKVAEKIPWMLLFSLYQILELEYFNTQGLKGSSILGPFGPNSQSLLYCKHKQARLYYKHTHTHTRTHARTHARTHTHTSTVSFLGVHALFVLKIDFSVIMVSSWNSNDL